ncbi:MAG: tRNA modification GTPase [Planctomycetaceae bacterium]
MIGWSDPRTTIVAIASATSPALRGAVRMAGEDAIDVLQRMVADPIPPVTRPSRVPIRLCLPDPLGTLDAVALVWPTSRSYCGCPSVEIHTVGALPILEATVNAATAAGARPAGPGEFTLRAFLAGRLDLTQAEAVLGVIDATNRSQLDAALTQLAGNLSAPLREARDQLLDMLADLEAGLDFVEEDISFIDDQTLRAGLLRIAERVAATSRQMQAQRRSESFHWVVLRGRPNAGKSSLLNSLADESVAIVSDEAGTTRDVVWREIDIHGRHVRIADTAGIETGHDPVTAKSQQAAATIEQVAAIVLQCHDARQLPASLAELESTSTPVIRVATKGDTIDEPHAVELAQQGWLVTSAVQRSGLDRLRSEISRRLDQVPGASDLGVPGTAARCADAIDRAATSLRQAVDLLDLLAGHELIAVEMRQALAAIGEVTGEIYTDDILDRVFSRFCIGK